MCIRLVTVFALAALPGCLFADFSYEQKTQITGGAMAGAMKFVGAFSKELREPMVSTTVIKGNRLAHITKRSTSVIDLDSETITEINHEKKTYSVMTFAEMTQAMNEAMQRMKASKDANKDAEKVDADYKIDVKNTGKSKMISGLMANEQIMTFEMQAKDKQSGATGNTTMTVDAWIAPKVPGYDELRNFYMKMGAKMAWTPGAQGMMGGGADMAKGMARVSKEMSKLDGIPVLQITHMGGSVEGVPASETQSSPSSARKSEPGEKPTVGGVLGGAIGGRFGIGKKKKEAPKEEAAKQEPAQAPPQQTASGSGSLMEMTTEMTNFSSASVDASRFAPPAGFKKVESELTKAMRR